MLFQTSVQLGHAQLPMGAVRRRVADEMPTRDPAGRFFVVRHADQVVCATAMADTADDLDELVASLEHAAQQLVAAQVLTDGPVVDDAGAAAARLALLLPA